MTVKKNEVALLIGILGAAIAVAVYVWVFLPYQDKTAAVKADNITQGEYLAKLEDWQSRVETLKADTEKMVTDVNETFNRFPVKSKAEDAIMYAVELESQDPETFISAIGIDSQEMIYEAAPTSVKLNDTDEQGTHTYQLYRQKITYTQEFSYNGMKRFVNSIVKNSDRRAIENLNMAYDSTTGILVGTTEMDLFTLVGTETEYQKTSIPPMPMGTNNIFGTLDRFLPPVEPETEAE